MAHQASMGGGGYTVLLFAFVFSLVISMVFIALNYYQFSHRPQPRYAATTPNGQVIPIETVDSAIQTPEQLLDWAQRAIIASNTFGFSDYPQQLAKAARYYSPDGWDAFYQMLQQSGALQQVIANKINTRAVATGAPRMVDQSEINGRWLFLIQMPIMVQYEFQPKTEVYYYNVTIRIQRDPDTWKYPKGISVVNYRMAPGHDPQMQGNP